MDGQNKLSCTLFFPTIIGEGAKNLSLQSSLVAAEQGHQSKQCNTLVKACPTLNSFTC
jgi:hypothetical protein